MAVWWLMVRAVHPVGTLTWSELKALLQQQLCPIDVAHRACDRWAACRVIGGIASTEHLQTFKIA